MVKSSEKLPQTLSEALVGQPLSYLVPLQNLAKHALSEDLRVNVEPEAATMDYQLYMQQKKLLDSDNPDYAGLRRRAFAGLDLGTDMSVFKLNFGITDKLPEPGQEQYSLFDGLTGLAREIANSVPMISDEELLKRPQDVPVPSRAEEQVPDNDQNTNQPLQAIPNNRQTPFLVDKSLGHSQNTVDGVDPGFYVLPRPVPHHPQAQIWPQIQPQLQLSASQWVNHFTSPLLGQAPAQIGAGPQEAQNPNQLSMPMPNQVNIQGQYPYIAPQIPVREALGHGYSTRFAQMPNQACALHTGMDPKPLQSPYAPPIQSMEESKAVHFQQRPPPSLQSIPQLAEPPRSNSPTGPEQLRAIYLQNPSLFLSPEALQHAVPSHPSSQPISQQNPHSRSSPQAGPERPGAAWPLPPSHAIQRQDIRPEYTSVSTPSQDPLTSPEQSSIVNSAGQATTATESSKRESLPSPLQEQQKKQRIDVSLQHLEMERLCIQQLNLLVSQKIFFTDEDAEYESGDVWLELPNSDHVLRDNVLQDIHSNLAKIPQNLLVSELPFKTLERIQQVCIRSVRNANEVDWTNDDDEDAALRVLRVNAPKATLVILLILLMNRPEKQLLLEDYVMDCLTFTYKFTEDYTLRKLSTGKLDQSTIATSSMVARLLGTFAKYVSTNYLNDTVIIKLVYLAVKVIFQEVDRQFNSVKHAAMGVLVTIFEHRKDQRSFIVDELLVNFDRLPTHKVNSRTMAVRDGPHIQFITLLIVRLLSTFRVREVYGNETDVVVAQLTHDDMLQRALEDEKFIRHVKEVFRERREHCLIIASALVDKLIKSPSFKAVLELFIADLSNMVSNPAFACIEPLLCCFTELLQRSTAGQPVMAETVLLELLGLIGTCMLELKGTSELVHQSVGDLKQNYSITISATAASAVSDSWIYDTLVLNWIGGLVGSFEDYSTVEMNGEKKDNYDTFLKLVSWHQLQKSSDLITSTPDKSASMEKARAEYKIILQNSEFISLYQDFLNHLLQSIDHPKIKSRTRALKNLAMLIEKDPRLAHIPAVNKTLTNKINDPSPSVKLAVLDIFDQFILQKPELIDSLYQSIVLTNDKSTAVRNKSIKIATRIINDTTDPKIHVFLLEKILKRLNDDEESVLESAKNALTDIIFLSPSYKANGSAIALKEECSKLILTIGKLVAKSSTNWDLFESFFFDDIIRLTNDNKRSHGTFLDCCQKMTECLLGFIIDNMDTAKQDAVDICLGLLSIFSKSAVPFINQDQLMSLQPYFTGESSGSGSTLYYSLVILRHSLAHISSLRDQFITNTLTSLLKRLTKLGVKELEQAMPSLWTLAVMGNDTLKIANATSTCLKLLLPYIEQVRAKSLVTHDSKLVRLLYLLGAFGKYCDLERNRDVFLKVFRSTLHDKETVRGCLAKYLIMLTAASVNDQVRKAALRNLIHIATTHPELFTNRRVLEVLDYDLLNREDLSVKSTMFEGILEFLEAEEKQATRPSEEEKKHVDKITLINGDQKLSPNDDICASLSQRYLDTAVQLCSLGETNTEVFPGVKFVRYVVRMGFANPVSTIGPVIDMQLSDNVSVRTVGIELLTQLHERHESLLDGLYANCVLKAFSFKFKKVKEETCRHILFIRGILKVIDDSKSARKKFLKLIPKTFDFKHSKSAEHMYEMEVYAAFISVNLVEFDFSTNEEVFILIDRFEAMLTDQAAHVRSELRLQSDDIEVRKALGHRASLLVIISDFVKTLRHNYKLPESASVAELKTLKTKIVSEKSRMTFSFYNDMGDAIFKQLETLLI